MKFLMKKSNFNWRRLGVQINFIFSHFPVNSCFSILKYVESDDFLFSVCICSLFPSENRSSMYFFYICLGSLSVSVQ